MVSRDAQSPAARDDGELGAFVVRFFEHYGHGMDWARVSL